jgi:hypothetical protein
VTYKLLDSYIGSCQKLWGRGGSSIQNTFGSGFEGRGYGNKQRLQGLVGMNAAYKQYEGRYGSRNSKNKCRGNKWNM